MDISIIRFFNFSLFAVSTYIQAGCLEISNNCVNKYERYIVQDIYVKKIHAIKNNINNKHSFFFLVQGSKCIPVLWSFFEWIIFLLWLGKRKDRKEYFVIPQDERRLSSL